MRRDIETERLILRKFGKNDVEDLFELLKDEEVNTFLPWFPLKNIEETEKFLDERFLETYKRGLIHRYAICLKEDNKPIGYVWLSEDESRDFGYALRKEFWYKGIVTEAAKRIIEEIKNDGYSYITATHDINNPRSGEVMRKLGMDYKYSYIERVEPKNTLVTFRLYQINFDEKKDRAYMEYWHKYKNGFKEDIN